jgi:hypothetical protein
LRRSNPASVTSVAPGVVLEVDEAVENRQARARDLGPGQVQRRQPGEGAKVCEARSRHRGPRQIQHLEPGKAPAMVQPGVHQPSLVELVGPARQNANGPGRKRILTRDSSNSFGRLRNRGVRTARFCAPSRRRYRGAAQAGNVVARPAASGVTRLERRASGHIRVPGFLVRPSGGDASGRIGLSLFSGSPVRSTEPKPARRPDKPLLDDESADMQTDLTPRRAGLSWGLTKPADMQTDLTPAAREGIETADSAEEGFAIGLRAVFSTGFRAAGSG